jgi:tetratricopeptide (TPR) repeat protein
MTRRLANHDRPISRLSMRGAIAAFSVPSFISSTTLIALTLASSFNALVPVTASASDLNRQLTIHLNSGSRSTARDEADRLTQWGQSQAAQGDWARAIGSWQRALQLYQTLGDMDAQGMIYGYLASAYAQTGQPRATEDALRRQLAVTRDQRDFSSQVYANNNLGRALAPRSGGSPGAGTLFVEGMEVAGSLRHHSGERLTAKNITWLANSLDQPDLTMRNYEVAFLPSEQWYANPVSYATQLNDRGEGNLQQRRYYMASRLHGVADSLASRSGDAANQFRAIDDLVIAFRAMGRYDRATDVLGDRLLLAQRTGNVREELASLTALGTVNQEVGRIELAQGYYERAIAVADQLSDAQQASVLRERLASFQAPTEGDK